MSHGPPRPGPDTSAAVGGIPVRSVGGLPHPPPPRGLGPVRPRRARRGRGRPGLGRVPPARPGSTSRVALLSQASGPAFAGGSDGAGPGAGGPPSPRGPPAVRVTLGEWFRLLSTPRRPVLSFPTWGLGEGRGVRTGPE